MDPLPYEAIRIVQLPILGSKAAYSPEMNPDEYLNRDTKAHMAE